MSIAQLTHKIVAFRDERDWAQFHSPRNLAEAISIEASELLEVFLWKPESGIPEAIESDETRERLSEELADVLIYALLLAYELGIEPSDAIEAKLKVNEERYPVEKSRGSSAKYDEL